MDWFGMLESFLSNKFNQKLIVGLLILGGLVYFLMPEAQMQKETTNTTIYLFYIPTCSHCAAEKIFLKTLVENYPEVNIIAYDATQTSVQPLYKKFITAYKIPVQPGYISAPLTFIGRTAISGYLSDETTGKKIESAAKECIERGCPSALDIAEGRISNEGIESETVGSGDSFTINVPFFGDVSLLNYSLPLATVIIGLVDGFNPCAMWVLVYLISILVGVKSKKRIWFIVGSFVAASGALYFLFMTAWLNTFLLLGYIRAITVLVGLVALGAAILNLKDYWESKGAVACKVGDLEDKKKTGMRIHHVATAPVSIGLLIAIVVLAFAVNSIEFVCSSALPAIYTQILALHNLSQFEYYGYILLYDLFFMLDDMIIFGIAAFTLSSGGIGEKYAGYSKLIGGAVMLILGIVLLFAPGLIGQVA